MRRRRSFRRFSACDVHRRLRPYPDRLFVSDHTTPQEAGMPRGDELREQYRLSDRDDDVDDLGYGGGGSSSYDDDDEEDGGWMTHKDDSDDLWDSTDDVDEDEEETVTVEATDDEDE